MNTASIKRIMLNSLIADALAASFEGHSRGHILSSHVEEDGIMHMKLNSKELHKWRKPLLYSSISQLMLLSAMTTDKKGDMHRLFSALNDIALHDGPGAIRHADRAETDFINRNPGPYNSARLLSQSLALSLHIAWYRFDMRQCLDFCFHFTKNPLVIHGIILLAHAAARYLAMSSPFKKILSDLAEINTSLISQYSAYSPLIFENGINPDNFTLDTAAYTALFKNLSAQSSDNNEKNIVEILNKNTKSPITRSSINHPVAAIGAAINSVMHDNSGQIINNSIKEGGATAPRAFITAFLFSLTNEDFDLSATAFSFLINKNYMDSLINTISENKCTVKDVTEFIDSERSLSFKEAEEIKSKNKHNKHADKKTQHKKTKKTSTREDELNRHVVESWTKIDQAKWRKKRHKFSDDNADNI